MSLKKTVLTALLFCFAIGSYANGFVEGKDYKIIASAKSTPTPELIEFFSYGCPWCYKLEKDVETLEQSLPKDTDFKRIPVTFESGWTLYAKAYYTAKALKMEKKLSPLLFNEIQENNALNSKQAMVNFFVKQGASAEFVESAFSSSPAMNALVKNGISLMQKYQVYAIPSFVINGKYKTGMDLAKGDPKKLIAIIQYLLAKDTATPSQS